ncbi:MAG TPA: AAC(3) family N-acetyltransferase [Thermoplasmata archaeon]|nr:AAC(3) family N-acetyltransferase [Thermoplasmata archaeon]
MTTGLPATRKSLCADLRGLGLSEGSTVLVHSSLSALGWVVGGAQTVVLALEDAIGATGTLMMPAYSLNAPEPSVWRHPPVPESWWEMIRNEWPPFDREFSPSRHLGTIAETFRHQPGTERSEHPNDSFCARGPKAKTLLESHSLDNGLGEGSPLARLYDLRGLVLLLGVDHSSNSSLHLAEYRAEWPDKHSAPPFRARMIRDGSIVEVVGHDIDINSDDFGRLGLDFESELGLVRTGPLGAGTGRLMDQRALVDFGVTWIEKHRTPPPGRGE